MKNIKKLNVSNSGIAFDPRSGDSFQLNELAEEIILLEEKGMTAEEIAQRLSQEYSIPYEQTLTDVLEFQVQLKMMGLAA